MNKKHVYKYRLKKIMEQDILLPSDAKILSVEEQRGDIVLYALVDYDAPAEITLDRRRIYIYCTGSEVHNPLARFIGTVKLGGGEYMFHVFESTP